MNTVRLILLLLSCECLVHKVSAQDEQADQPLYGFQKNHLFTGGGISFGLGSNSFQVGANPFLGYNLAEWVDAGIVVNYNYASFRDVLITGANDKLRSTTYGGGLFTRLYPVNFIFIHAQFEHNFIKEKLIPGNGGSSVVNNVEANSLLLGAGYASERYPGSGNPFFYISILFDVLDNEYSPYSRAAGGIKPILRAGIQVPIFQGK